MAEQPKFSVRPAMPRDVSALLALLARFHAEASEALAWPPISELHLMHAVANVLTNGRALLALQDGRLVGSLGLRIDSFFWSGTPYVGDVWFYVLPGARSFPLFKALLEAAQGWAKGLGGDKPGLVPLMFGTVNADEIERLDELYRKVGFSRIGGMYVMGL
jgi:GNAT superfamily N-acetyltransferase